jgi:hypothetical protein
MKRTATKRSLIVFLCLTVPSGGFYGYHLYSTRPKPVFISIEEIEHIDPNRIPRIVNRSRDMELAVAEISAFFRRIIMAGRDANTEVRYYRSPRDNSASALVYGWRCDRLQAFHVNPDQSKSPLGNVLTLPENIVCRQDASCTTEYADADKKFVTQSVDGTGVFSANIVLFDLRLGANQVPEKDRTITILDGRVYDDGGDDILRKVSLHEASD